MTEHDLHLLGTRYFFDRGWRVFNELNFHGCYICDQVLLRGEQLILVEYKLRDYKGGIRQADLNAMVTPSSYVLMPRLIRGSISQFRHWGIGLMIFDGLRLQIPCRPRCRFLNPDRTAYHRQLCFNGIAHMLQNPSYGDPLFHWQVPERFWQRGNNHA
jgi:hypothetical protein